MFLSRDDWDLGVAFQTHPGVRRHLEGKQRTSFSSRVTTGISWSPLSGLKGVKPPLQFGERTRDCSPGHAGKEGPRLEMTGASRGFSRAAAPVWGFSRGTTGSSGSLLCGAREVPPGTLLTSIYISGVSYCFDPFPEGPAQASNLLCCHSL